jgi:hypothetical protein
VTAAGYAFAMLTRPVLLLSLVAALSFGCDKSKGGGASSAADAELLKSLPSSSNVMAGGDVAKLKELFADPAITAVTDKIATGMKTYVECFYKQSGLHFAAGVSVANGKASMRTAMSGIDIPTVSKCATDAGFKVTTDADNKFVSIQVPATVGAMTQTYLALGDGTLYGMQALGAHAGTGVSRADLEADAAATAKANAADDPKAKALLAKADRSKTMWFVGTAAGTRLGDKVGEISGSLDLTPDVAFVVDVQITDAALATQIDGYMSQAKTFAASLPADIKAIAENLDYKKDGDHLHFGIKATLQQVKALFKTAGGLLGGFAR